MSGALAIFLRLTWPRLGRILWRTLRRLITQHGIVLPFAPSSKGWRWMVLASLSRHRMLLTTMSGGWSVTPYSCEVLHDLARRSPCVFLISSRQLLAPPDVVDELIKHIQTYEPQSTDLRSAVRAVEAVMLSTHAAALVGNQVISDRVYHRTLRLK